MALPGVLLSQALIAGAWSDAKFGAAANPIVLVPLVLAALDARPGSLRSRFTHDVRVALAAPMRYAPLVTDADVATLPPLMQGDLRRVGAIGRPRVRNVRTVSGIRIGARGETNWIEPRGEWTYGRFAIEEIAYNILTAPVSAWLPRSSPSRHRG